MLSAGHPSTTTRMLVAAALLPVAAVGATQRGSVADAATGCGSDDLTVTVRITDAVPGFWWQHALYNVTPSSTTRGGPLLDHLVVPLPAPLGAGVYDVTAVTMDDHSFSLIPDTACTSRSWSSSILLMTNYQPTGCCRSCPQAGCSHRTPL